MSEYEWLKALFAGFIVAGIGLVLYGGVRLAQQGGRREEDDDDEEPAPRRKAKARRG